VQGQEQQLLWSGDPGVAISEVKDKNAVDLSDLGTYFCQVGKPVHTASRCL